MSISISNVKTHSSILLFYSTKLLVSRNTLDLRGEWGGEFRPHITLADLPKALDVAVVANDRDELFEAMASHPQFEE